MLYNAEKYNILQYLAHNTQNQSKTDRIFKNINLSIF